MVIIKGDSPIATLRDKPKDFEAYACGGVISLETPEGTIRLGEFDNAGQLVTAIHNAYFGGASTFTLPEGSDSGAKK